MATIDYGTAVTTSAGESTDLEAFRGKVLLVVNTATHCGFTGQLYGLEALQKEYGDRGFAVLGFPSNEFGGQSPGTDAEIADFCKVRYGAEFPMFAKVHVNGASAHPLFAQLKAAKSGALGLAAIKWNFTKFLVGPDGEILARYGSRKPPSALREDIENALPDPA